MADSFVYSTQLGPEEIRLLRVHSGVGDALIECDLVVYNWADIQGHYNALSYTWGSTSFTEHVLCNGADLAITANLRAALWQYRENDDSGLLWVDAVCVNQNNVQEKTIQVRKMQAIYENAKTVIIWIGEKHDDDILGLELFKQLACIPTIIEAESMTVPFLDLASEGLPRIQDSAWASMFRLLKRRWFYRSWIIQEAIVNQNTVLRCGDVDTPFKTVLIAGNAMLFWNIVGEMHIQITQRLLGDPDTQEGRLRLPNILHLGGINRARQNNSDFMFTYLIAARLFEATDPRDKIFSLIGVAAEIPEDFINYEANLRQVIATLCCELIMAITEIEGYYPSSPVDLLAWVHILRSQWAKSNLPTWVPDFSNSWNTGVAIPYLMANPSEELVSPKVIGRGGWDIRETQIPGTFLYKLSLFTRTRHFETILETFDLVTMCDTSPEALPTAIADLTKYRQDQNSLLNDAVELVARSCSKISLEKAEETLWRTLLCNRSTMGTPLTQTDWHSFQAARSYFRTHDGEKIPKEEKRLMGTFLTSIGTIGPNHILFVSQDGRSGMASAEAKAGDQVHFFLGSAFPLVLRPAAEAFTLVGDCYLHGVMEGEAHDDLSSFTEIEIV